MTSQEVNNPTPRGNLLRSNWISADYEAGMEQQHPPYWQAFINQIDADLRGHTVLDFGCNRGGFLRLLYAQKPFKSGIGIDVVSEPIEVANRNRGTLPIHYEVAADLDRFAGQIDTAFSHEVIYLLPDLPRHASEISTALKPGGSYYAVTACHNRNPVWPEWRQKIQETLGQPLPDYSLEDYAKAFVDHGFAASAVPLRMDQFISISFGNDIVPSIQDHLDSAMRYTIVFRFTKPHDPVSKE